jgi:hypothetical protein
MPTLNAEPLAVLKHDARCESDATLNVMLSAYVHAEEMRTFNRMLLRRLALLGVGWLLVGHFAIQVGWPALLTGCAMVIAGGLCGIVAEHRARSLLRSLLTR